MRRFDTSREGLPDLLVRPPTGSREFVTQWSHLIVDPVRQLEALADSMRPDCSPALSSSSTRVGCEACEVLGWVILASHPQPGGVVLPGT